MAKKYSFLHLEDDPLDAELVEAELRKEWPDCHYVLVCTESGLCAALAGEKFDAILSDYALPNFDGMAALSIVMRGFIRTPFLFVTGAMGEEMAIETLRNGATDYILKTRISKLIPALQRALHDSEAGSEFRRVEQQLKRNHEHLELMQEVVQFRTESVQELLDFALNKVLALTESTFGYIYHYSEEKQQFVLNSWSKGVMDACQVIEPQSVYKLEMTGVWGDVVRQRKSIIINDYQAPNPRKKGFPEGHVPLANFMSIPVFEDGKIVAVAGVANKAVPYDQTDVIQLELMMDGVWKVTARLRMAEQIARAGKEWQSTFDSISDSVAIIDNDQQVLRCNVATSRLLGLGFDEIIGQPCWKLFHDTGTPHPDCPMEKAKRSRHSESTTIQWHDRWLDVTVDLLMSDKGEVVGAVHIVRDVTERTRLVNSVQEVNDLFNLFIKHSPIFSFIKEVIGSNSLVLRVSDNYSELAGISASDMSGKSMHQIFPKEFADKVTADDLRVLDSHEVSRLEEELGGRSYITYKFPIPRDDNRKLLAGYTIDITDLKQAEAALKKQASVMSAVLESTDSAVYSLDTSLCYISFNSAHMKIMKELYGADIRIGGSIIDRMTEEDAGLTKVNLERALAGEAFIVEADSGDTELIRTVFEFSHNPIRDDNGRITGVSVFAQNICNRRRSEQSLREMQAQMMQNDKLATVGQLAAGVAHEINNPMGFVGSNMLTLAKYIEKYNRYIGALEQEVLAGSAGVLPERLQSLYNSLKLNYVTRDINLLIEESNEGIERVRRIVKDLMTFSHADSAVTSMADLNSCMDSTINIVINEIKYFAELKREYGCLPKVSCNVQQVNQVFMNLLVNAAHAIQNKGEEIGEIIIRTWSNHENVFVSVSDTGCGIPHDNVNRIFDAFFTTKEVGKGTGLGLAISAGIVRKHGGEIVVASQVGVGTTFTMRLPLNFGGKSEMVVLTDLL